MKMLFVTLFVAAFTIVAETNQPPRKPARPINKELRKQLIEKYDENKDGALSNEERLKITTEDRKRLREAGLGQPKGDKPPGPKPPRAPHNKE